MSPIFSQNECFVQPFYDHWLKLQTFSQKGEKWTLTDICQWLQYLAKTNALCNHFTTIGPNYRPSLRKANNGLQLIYANESNKSENVCFVQPFDSMWPKPPTFSHNAEKWTEIDLCEWGQYLPKTYALCNHFTACSPNFRLFRRMAKTGLKSINANVANI